MTKYYKNNYVWANLILYIRDVIDYCSLFLGELTAESFNKIWNKTYYNFKNKYNLELI